MSEPVYLKAYASGCLQQVAELAWQKLANCDICPRACRVNRLKGEKGFCRTGLLPVVYSFQPHYGEEPPISGTRGSGTIFFSSCNMACVYCQNYEFSQSGQGREVEIKQLADFMLQLQGLKCHNINLVTPTHIMPQILKALVIAARCGLNIPLVYNTSGYERPESIKLLAGIVDIYLADIRYADETSAVKYSSSIAYPEFSRSSIKEMQRQVGIVKLDEEGIIKKGLVIRHLVLPQGISGTREVMKFLSEEISPDTYISLMSQYLPYYKAGSFPELARRISLKEYREAQVLMAEYGLHNGWTQGSYAQERFAGVHIKPGV